MNIRTGVRTLAGAGLVAAAFASPTAAADIAQPDCGRLEGWSAQLDPQATFQVVPGVTVNALFGDDLAEPLFGRKVFAWSDDDFRALRGWLNECRRAALKRKDKDAGTRLYEASKSARDASRAMGRITRARITAQRQVDSLLRQREAPEMAEILAIAQDALRGKDVAARVAALPPAWQGPGRQAGDLAQASAALTDEDRDALVAKLEARRAGAAQAQAARQDAMAELNSRLAAIPLTRQGLGQLNRLVYDTPTNTMSREELTAFNAAVQNKRNLIQRKMNAQQAAAEHARATRPAPAVELLNAVLEGDKVDALSIRGLAPGLPFAEAAAKAKGEWAYGEAATFGGPKQFTTTGRQLARFRDTERRDGGMLLFDTMRGNLGKITYIEHFTGPIDGAALGRALVQRLGKSDGGSQTHLEWHGKANHLKVAAGNRIARMERGNRGFRSSMVVELWSQAYADYLEAAKRRCAELRDKPAGELSTNEKQAILFGCLEP